MSRCAQSYFLVKRHRKQAGDRSAIATSHVGHIGKVGVERFPVVPLPAACARSGHSSSCREARMLSASASLLANSLRIVRAQRDDAGASQGGDKSITAFGLKRSA